MNKWVYRQILLSKLYRFWYSFDMTYYDDIYERAVDSNYLITTEEAVELGIPRIELVKLARRGRLEHLGHGLYRLARYVPADSDPYAIAVKAVGRDAYLAGESVLALLRLAPTNPKYICVATPRRMRKNLPPAIRVKQVKERGETAVYEGVPCQTAAEAILDCEKTMLPDRLKNAAARALDEGYITNREFKLLEERMGW